MGRHKSKPPESYQSLKPKQKTLLNNLVALSAEGKEVTQEKLAELSGYDSKQSVSRALAAESLQRAFQDLCVAAGIEPLKPFHRLNEALDANKTIALRGGGTFETADWAARLGAIGLYMKGCGFDNPQPGGAADTVVDGDFNLQVIQFYVTPPEKKAEPVTITVEAETKNGKSEMDKE